MNNLFIEHQKCLIPGNLFCKENCADVDISEKKNISGFLEHCLVLLTINSNMIIKVRF